MTQTSRVLYVGSFTDGELLKDLIGSEDVSPDFATNNFQKGFCQSLDCAEIDYDVVCLPFVRRKKINRNALFIYEGRNYKSESRLVWHLPNCTIPVFRTVWEFFLLFLLIPLLKIHRYERVIIFSPSPSFNLPFIFYSIIFWSRRKLICIVDDLPEFSQDFKFSGIRLMKKCYSKLFEACNRFYFGIIFLSSGAQKRIGIGCKNWMLMEGVLPNESFDDLETHIPEDCFGRTQFINTEYILYTGSLDNRQGVANLIKGFLKIIDDLPHINLVLCGQGAGRKTLERKYSNIKNIFFMDAVPRRELRHIMERSMCLVIPVDPSNDFTNFFFPSKLIEYMSSGTVTVGYRLGCIPSEYFPHFVEIHNSEGEFPRHCEISKTIFQILSMPEHERKKLGSSAKHFIEEYKGSHNWGKKLKSWLSL